MSASRCAGSLRTLFSVGVNTSEVLVLLLSKSLLTRPWCLLEIREAMRKHKPIVLLELTGPGHGFSFDEAFAMLKDIEANLPPLNPYAIDELRKHLDAGETLIDLQDIVLRAIAIGRSSRVPHLNINGCATHACSACSCS